MNISELKAELGRKDMNIPKLAEAIGMGKKQLYQRFKGEVSFTQRDILNIKKVLNLSDTQIIDFFNEKVS